MKVYNAEIAHPEMRGSLGAIIPAMASLGTLYTFLVSTSFLLATSSPLKPRWAT